MLQYKKHKDKQIKAKLLRPCGTWSEQHDDYLEKALGEGVAMRREFVVNDWLIIESHDTYL
jgi:hypothetical protein